MKNLKKLVVIGAILGATHGAKAFEKEFEPAKNGGDQRIELINGQLMVKTEGGKVGNMDMPYTFVGTNTTNFAQSGFAVKEMADTNSIWLDKDNNDVYFTRSSTNGVYKMTVSDKTALNGIGKVEFFESAEPVKVLSVKDGVIYTQNTNNNQVVELGNVEAAKIPSVILPASTTNNLYFVSTTGNTYVFENNGKYNIVKEYGSDGKATDTYVGSWSNFSGEALEMVVFPRDEKRPEAYILNDKGSLYRNGTKIPDTDIAGQGNILGIKMSKDGKSLLITSNKGGKTVVSSYNPKETKQTAIYDEADKPFGQKEVFANKIRYFVRDKSIGYE